MKKFKGKVLFLDRSDINTDEIIAARYLTGSDKKELKPYLLEDLDLPGFDAARDLEDCQVIVSRSNFGCGSSREHAPWALELNDFNLVIAENFARIFRQNMLNCGLLPLVLSTAKIDELFTVFNNCSGTVIAEADIQKQTLRVSNDNQKIEHSFELTGFAEKLIKSEGWINYAVANY